MMLKIDVARAFRNLRVDPVDVMKLGMTWRGQYYLSSAVVFGWKHGMASFQLVADAISYIMAQEGCKVLSYVDDFWWWLSVIWLKNFIIHYLISLLS